MRESTRLGDKLGVFFILAYSQYFGHFMQRIDSLEKTLMLGKIKGKRRREPERIRWLDNMVR